MQSQGKSGEGQKGTSCREALKQWEENTGEKAVEAKEIKLIGIQPPIEKLDSSIQTLANCEKLSLSTNTIEKLSHLNNLRCLKILSLGRNNIKNFTGLEVLADTLEQLWISYNFVEKMKGIGVLKKLRVLYMSNNLVKDWVEFLKLLEVTTLEELNFVGNPLEEKHSADGNWRTEVERKLTLLKNHEIIDFEVLEEIEALDFEALDIEALEAPEALEALDFEALEAHETR
ncbi:hypothetical protein Pcinc_017679 [Petrolisthes cinctipes]|uniref:Dynein axonemal light chain 1 n=1 Tax=Petrolisthes cinctipes TaxID=88211 RepID=A0AAE1KMI1_PETCI|nr:hypothetical protein Pcinc_017679 [Petrolisthes cinctipes]